MVALAIAIRSDPLLSPLVVVLLQLHDEIIVELPRRLVPQVAALVRRSMEHTISDAEVPFPVTIAVGRNLGDMHEIE